MRYLVRNNRIRKVQKLFGSVLGSIKSGGAGEMWLSEEQWESDAVQTRIAQKRIVLVRTDPPGGPFLEDDEEEPAAPEPSEEEVEEEVEPTDSEAEDVGEDVEEDLEDEEEETPPEPEEVTEDEPEEDEEDELEDEPEASDDEDESEVDEDGDPVLGYWDFDSLKARGYRDNQRLAKKYDVKASGTEEEIIGRLLELQEEEA